MRNPKRKGIIITAIMVRPSAGAGGRTAAVLALRNAVLPLRFGNVYTVRFAQKPRRLRTALCDADILLLEPRGDAPYLKQDPQSSYSQ